MIPGLTFTALLDTHATVNPISPELFEKHSTLRRHKLSKEVIIIEEISACSKDNMKQDTVVTLNVNILERNFRILFYVVQQLYI